MGTLLQNNVAPLWVWVVVIAVGSVLILATFAFVVRCCVKRRRAKSNKDLESNRGSTRKVTLRHGQLVEKTSHASLTGDGFGYRTDRGPPMVPTPDLRSKSPFDWWAGVKERSVSRQSQNSQETSFADSTTSTAASPFRPRNNSSPPRLSLSSLNDPGNMQTGGTLSEVSSISRPLIATTAESRKARTVNFSRPQPRRTATEGSKNARLSIINETTPRNSFLSISSLRARIASWTGSPYELDSQAEPREAKEKRDGDGEYFGKISDVAPTLTLSFESSDEKPMIEQTDETSTLYRQPTAQMQSPVDLALQQLSSMVNAPTPEVPARHPSRRSIITSQTEEPDLSRSSSIANFSRRPGVPIQAHSRTNSATNFSRKPANPGSSRSSSMNRAVTTTTTTTTNFSRIQPASSDHSRTNSNTSWFEAPVAQATLSEPFDMPIACRGSRASVWSSDTTLQQQTFQTPTKSAADLEQTEAAKTRPKTVALDQPRAAPAPPKEDKEQRKKGDEMEQEKEKEKEKEREKEQEKEKAKENRRSRGRSTERERSRSRGPIQGRSLSKGRNVLRKRSMGKPDPQMPEIQMLGAIDPSSLEHLSVADQGQSQSQSQSQPQSRSQSQQQQQ